jgi:hypothetical protein
VPGRHSCVADAPLVLANRPGVTVEHADC